MSRTIDEILMPGGNPIGMKGRGRRASAKIREVIGGVSEAEEMFRELTEGGAEDTSTNYPGTLITLPSGRGTIGYRPASRSGPPTIDVWVVDPAGQKLPIDKIEFEEQGASDDP